MYTRHERVKRAGSRLWIPFSVYAAVTVLVPLLRRADRQEGFWEHACVALLVPALIVMTWTGLRRLVALGSRRAHRGAELAPRQGKDLAVLAALVATPSAANPRSAWKKSGAFRPCSRMKGAL